MKYLYRCPVPGCEVRADSNIYAPSPDYFPACGAHTFAGARRVDEGLVVMVRDYRAENVAPQVLPLKREREAGGPSAVRDLFLPTAKDFESPSDPDGQKGIRAWADEQKPKDGNKKPHWPDMKKKTFAVGK